MGKIPVFIRQIRMFLTTTLNEPRPLASNGAKGATKVKRGLLQLGLQPWGRGGNKNDGQLF
jgi:hypothetical protein